MTEKNIYLKIYVTMFEYENLHHNVSTEIFGLVNLICNWQLFHVNNFKHFDLDVEYYLKLWLIIAIVVGVEIP